MKTKSPRWHRKAQERPAALFDAALKTFSEKGFHATRLEDVAELAGVSKGTIYNYFESKTDLLLKAMEHRMQLRLVEMESSLAGFQGSAEEKLVLLLTNTWANWQCPEWRKFQRFFLGEIAMEFPEFFSEWMQRSPKPLRILLERTLEEGKQDGSFRKDLDSVGATRVVVSSMVYHAVYHLGFTKKSAQPKEAAFILKSILDLFLHSIRNPQKDPE